MIPEDVITVVEVLIVGPAIMVISGVIWAVWGAAQAAQGVHRWWTDLGDWLAA